MKKFISISLSVLLIMTTFIACNGDVDEKLWNNKSGSNHSHVYAVQTDGSWKCSCGKVHQYTDAPYFALVANGSISKIVPLTVNYQSGEIDGLTYSDNSVITYNTDASNTVYIRTKEGQTLTVHAPSSNVFHYGGAEVVVIQAVNSSSYHLTGTVNDLVVKKGHIVLEDSAVVKDLSTAKSSDGTDITIQKQPTAKIEILAVYESQAANIKVNEKAVNTSETNAIIGNGTDSVVQINGNANEQLYRVDKVVFNNLSEAKTAAGTDKAVRIVKDVSTTETDVKENEVMKIALDVTVTIPSENGGMKVSTGGTLEVYGDVENRKTITNDGTIKNYGSIITTGSDTALDNKKDVKNYGTIDAASGAKISTTGTNSNIENYGKIDVKEGGTLEVSAESKVTNASSGEITNKGTIKNDGEIKDSGKITNEGANAEIVGEGKIETTGESSKDSNIYVAAIGDKKYLTLEEAAVAADRKSVTVDLLQDIDFSEKYAVASFTNFIFENDTVDLKGHSISGKNASIAFDGDNMTVKNGKFVGTNGASYGLFVGNGIYKDRISTGIVLEDLEFVGGVNVFAAEVTIRKTTVEAETYYAVWADTAAKITVESGTFKSNSTKGHSVINADETSNSIMIKGGTYEALSDSVKMFGTETDLIVVEGGIFNRDPSSNLAPGYIAVKDKPEAGKWTVEKNTPEAQIGNTSYDTLTAAIDAVPDGQETTIKILRDISYTTGKDINKHIEIGENKNIILDLNGKVVYSFYNESKTYSFIENKGKLTVKDSGTGGKIEAHSDNNEGNGSDGQYTVKNENIFIMNGGSIVESSINVGRVSEKVNLKWSLRNEAGSGITSPVCCTINGGSVIGSYNAISNYVYDNSRAVRLEINGGEIKSSKRFSVLTLQNAEPEATQPDFTVEITGGKFVTSEAGNATIYFDNQAKTSDFSKVKISVTGGEFNPGNSTHLIDIETNYNDVYDTLGEISGGIFSFDPSACVAPGYVAVKDKPEAGKWTVETLFAGGKGTETEPFLVSNKNQFQKMVSGTSDKLIYYKLTNDLHFEEEEKVTPQEDKYGVSYLLYFSNACLDGNGKIITTYNNSYGDYFPFIVFKTTGNVLIKNLQVSNGNPIIRIVEDNLTFENVDTFGTVSGADNNMCARYVQRPLSAEGNATNITFKNCDNYSNIIGTGYVGVYIGQINKAKELSLCFEDCDNYGQLLSTKEGYGATMLISNGTNYSHNSSKMITINNCSNKGIISFVGDSFSSLVLNKVSDGSYQNISINDVQVTTVDSINNLADSSLSGEKPRKISSIGALTVQNNKFVLPKCNGAVKYELQFSFTGLNGANFGYKFMFDNENLSQDIEVNDWISKSDVTGQLTENKKYGTTYYTWDNHYVYNVDNASIRGNVLATFIAYDSDDHVINISTYTYPSSK